jgi:carbon-monoxide dehydrogenase iron sulfur subunit
VVAKGTVKILTSPDKCTGYLRCALACSFFVSPERTFNPSKSRIVIVPTWDQKQFDIAFTEECTNCGICVKYCEFGALSRHSAEDLPNLSDGLKES